MSLFHFRKLYISFLLFSGSGLFGPPPSISKNNKVGFNDSIQNKERESDQEKETEESRNLGGHRGALAIVGDIYLRNGEQFNVRRDDTVKPNSSIVLEGDTTIIRILGPANHHFNSLTVESGSPMLGFSFSINSIFIIDDLIIKNDSFLRMELFDPAGSGEAFLVKKTSRHLQDSLDRIRSYFDNTVRYGVRESNMYRDYWEIGTGKGFNALPEPATYGGIWGAVSLGLALYGRRTASA